MDPAAITVQMNERLHRYSEILAGPAQVLLEMREDEEEEMEGSPSPNNTARLFLTSITPAPPMKQPRPLHRPRAGSIVKKAEDDIKKIELKLSMSSHYGAAMPWAKHSPAPPTTTDTNQIFLQKSRPFVKISTSSRVEHKIANAISNFEEFNIRAQAAIRYRAEHTCERADIIQRNVLRAATPRGVPQQTVEERVNEHRSRHLEVFTARQDHRRVLLTKHQDFKATIAANRLRHEHEGDYKDLLEMIALASRTKLFVNQALRIVTFRNGMSAYHAFTVMYARWKSAQQTSSRRRRLKRAKAALRFAFCIISCYVPILKKRKQTAVVAKFLGHVRSCSVIVRALRKLVRAIKIVQRKVREYIRFKFMRIQMGLLQFDKVEKELSTQYLAGVQKLAVPTRMFTAAMTNDQRIKTLLRYDPFTYASPIPFEMKLAAVTQEFASAQKLMATALGHYRRQMKQYSKSHEFWVKTQRRVGEPSKPPRPFFSVIFARMRMVVDKCLESYIDKCMVVRRNAAERVVRNKREGDYALTRDSLMDTAFSIDSVSKQTYWVSVKVLVGNDPHFIVKGTKEGAAARVSIRKM